MSTQAKRRTFEVGDHVTIDSAYKGSAQIQAIRHAVGNTRTGQLSIGADVLRGDGRTGFYYLHDLATWNPWKLENLGTAAPEMAAVLVEILNDQETMREPYRNEAICERIRAALRNAGVL